MTAERDAALTRLDDYTRGVSGVDGVRGEDAAAEYELDLFSRALSCEAPELQFRSELGRTFRAMNARGTLDIWLTACDVERLMSSGRRIHRFDLDVSTPSNPDLPEDFEILITRIPLPLEGVRRLDAEIFSLSGQRLKTMPDITFDAADGAVFACCEAELARTVAVAETVTRVYAIDDSGRRLLCEIKA